MPAAWKGAKHSTVRSSVSRPATSTAPKRHATFPNIGKLPSITTLPPSVVTDVGVMLRTSDPSKVGSSTSEANVRLTTMPSLISATSSKSKPKSFSVGSRYVRDAPSAPLIETSTAPGAWKGAKHSTVSLSNSRPNIGPMVPTLHATFSTSRKDPVIVITPPSVVVTFAGSTPRRLVASNTGSYTSSTGAESSKTTSSTYAGATYCSATPIAPLTEISTTPET